VSYEFFSGTSRNSSKSLKSYMAKMPVELMLFTAPDKPAKFAIKSTNLKDSV